MKKRMQVLSSLLLAVAMLAGCGSTAGESTQNAAETTVQSEDVATADESAAVDVSALKVGVIYIGDENEGYTEAHMKGIDEMMASLGLNEDQVVEKTNIPEDESCYDAAVDLADQGCGIIFATSFGHESYLLQAAAEYPEVDFYHATGYQAASSGMANVHNYFTAIYEARYVSGIVAGMKLNEMIDNGTITEDQAKVGYVGAFPYAEVVSGYTSFYLGAKSVCPSVTMEVQYTNSWADMSAEAEVAKQLIADDCVLISQHADTTGAPSSCEEMGVPCVGYNVDMTSVAPDAALTSAANNWGVYYTQTVTNFVNGVVNPVDWAEGYSVGAVYVTDLNKATVAEGTADAAAKAEAALADGSLHVFDTTTFTVEGKSIEDLIAEGGDYAKYADYVSDGYFHESTVISAPAFDLRIDGITEK
ncbi:MAG: BMP family ABC transporter substrate-binding protein [Lachnospiraceae bacterium]|nr:BMP family ABC transporter substrate-binding protein [Lachnospiraceae bacterium]